MHPLKNHRIVRQGEALLASGRARGDAASEPAKNEGWLSERPHPLATPHAGKEAIAAFPPCTPQ